MGLPFAFRNKDKNFLRLFGIYQEISYFCDGRTKKVKEIYAPKGVKKNPNATFTFGTLPNFCLGFLFEIGSMEDWGFDYELPV